METNGRWKVCYIIKYNIILIMFNLKLFLFFSISSLTHSHPAGDRSALPGFFLLLHSVCWPHTFPPTPLPLRSLAHPCLHFLSPLLSLSTLNLTPLAAISTMLQSRVLSSWSKFLLLSFFFSVSALAKFGTRQFSIWNQSIFKSIRSILISKTLIFFF